MLNLLNKKGKIMLGTVTLVIALVCVFVGGDNQQAEATEQGSISINLSMTDLKDIIGMLLGGFSSETAFGGSAGGSRFPSGLSADDTSPSAGEVRGTTATFTSTGNFTGAMTFGSTGSFAGLLTLNAGQIQSYTNSTSTTNTTLTLVAADILNYSTVVMTPNVSDVTFTLPATSTLSTMIPSAGDRMTQCWMNATTTADTDIIFAAGTGWDLEVASSTATVVGSLKVADGSMGCFEFARRPDTDITAFLVTGVDAD